ncbi:LysM peptidoglycan-binding domain-containing protein, partial [Streptomyces sp. NK15101]|uniref:LysM peptidoglycan-binding domain-containing protein n=1 Tax=Streptomyces sp. NK15101 TaxID=2873261 RepID=UPI0027DED3DD
APAAPATPTAPGTPDASVTPGTPDSPGTPKGDAPSAAPGTGKHRGEAAPEESGKSGSSVESGRHASSADKAEGKTENRPATGEVKDSGATDSRDTPGEYTVRPGDSLSGIARENELPGGWTALYDANRQTVGTDPDLILPGQSLDLTVGSTTAAG